MKTSILPISSQSQRRRFARYGIPDTFLSDNGPQYTSQEFFNFLKTYGFKLITWSPYYARATSKAEATVKEAKKMLKKSDLLTGLLDLRKTPPQGMTYSQHKGFSANEQSLTCQYLSHC